MAVNGELRLNVNGELIGDLLSKVMQAAVTGSGIDFSDADEVGQYVCSVLALAAEFIPVIGSVLGAFASLLGAICFSPMSMDRIWDGLRDRIEKLIDSKIESYHLEVLKQRVKGMQDNMNVYHPVPARTLHMEHIAFRSVVLAALPQFQHDKFAVASLPLFALVANIHLALLVGGIKKGREWGYQDSERLRIIPTEVCPGGGYRGRPGEGARNNNNSNIDYVSYTKNVYDQGRGEVKPYSADVGDRGGADAAKSRAYTPTITQV
ncbi:hypothetical protein NUW58_g9952 [Xylaria curta]|uniref:Uncharacterized protein n=1 Tax=Xylaria curta TaxID=42375 RepID=A0ACC1MRE9_9PEZI|nr:hypothetical protein NUW58_g9952 [Xylaria curta]